MSQTESDTPRPQVVTPELSQLIAQGRQRGFVTFEDIQAIVPNAEESVEVLDAIYAALAEAAIPVGDGGGEEVAPEEEVAGDGQLRDQRRVLVDRLDAVGDGVACVPQIDLLAADEDVAAGKRNRARKHLDQRRLAGAVVAEQSDDLTLVDMEVRVDQRLHLAVGFPDVHHPDQGFAPVWPIIWHGHVPAR